MTAETRKLTERVDFRHLPSNNVGCKICLYEYTVQRDITADKTSYLSRSVAETFLSVCSMTAQTQTVLFIYALGTVNSGCTKQGVWKGGIKPRKHQKNYSEL